MRVESCPKVKAIDLVERKANPAAKIVSRCGRLPAHVAERQAQAAKSYLELDYTGACVLVLGGEARGLHRLVREACDEVACIPLHGPVDSLNVSVAAGIVLYEATRQRHKGSRATENPSASS